MASYLDEALALGATETGWLPMEKVRFLPEVRKMCEDNRCGCYGTTWSCPPGCGDLEACKQKALSFDKAMLFTYAVKMEDPFDYEAIQEGSKQLRRIGLELREKMWKDAGVKRVLLSLPGRCAECETCQYPNPCAFPDRQYASPEAMGMWVSEICGQAGVAYNNGKNTITYVGLVFFDLAQD